MTEADQSDFTSDQEIRRRERKCRQKFIEDRSSAEFFVLSIPKSGRTWHRAMVGTYLARMCGESPQSAFELDRLCQAAGIKRIVYSHNGADFLDALPPSSDVVASPWLWQDRPVLLLVRNPRDVLVSAYHHAHFRKPVFPGTLAEFIRDPAFGIEKIMTAYRKWFSNRQRATSFDVISYEALHREPAKALSRTLNLVGVVEIDKRLVKEAIEFCSFANMQRYEQSDYFGSKKMKLRSADERAMKVRAGVVGGYRTYLTAADEAFIDDKVKSGGDPFADRY